MSLITQLKQISDPRHLRGRRHKLWVIFFLCLLGFLCGYPGYRPLASFCRNHEPSLRLLLGWGFSLLLEERVVRQVLHLLGFVYLYKQHDYTYTKLEMSSRFNVVMP